MMRWIVGSSLKFRRLVVAVAAGVMVLGFTQLDDTAVDVLPEFGPPTVEVQTEALGLSAEEVEQFITVPLEQDLLNGVAFLDQIHSDSLPGLSSVVLVFEPGTDLLEARQVVQERLTQAHALPNVSQPPQMLQPLSSTSRAMMLRLSSRELSAIELSVLARWVIRPRLMGVDGVANVAIWGQRERQLQVQVDPERLREQDVSLLQVIRTTGNALWVSPLSFLEASTPGASGFIDTPNQRLQIQHLLPITTARELARVPLEDREGAAVRVGGDTLRLGDVTDVVEDHQPLIGDAVFRDGGGLLLVIEKFPSANTLEVTAGVEAAFDAMRPGLAGVDVDASIFRPATYLEESAGNVGRALLIGAILLVIVLGLLFFHWRPALIVAVVVPLSLTAAGLVLYLRDVTVNPMLVAGLVMALGVVIDDAVGSVESLAVRLRRHRTLGRGAPVWRVVLDVTLEMRTSALSAALIVFLVLLPAFFLDGEPGAFLPEVAISFVLAVSASMVVALTVTPALGMLLLGTAPLGRGSPAVRWLQERYARFVSRVVPRGGLAVGGLALLIVGGLVAVPFLDRSLGVPPVAGRDILIHWEGEPGASLPAMNRITAGAVRELGRIPGVRNVGAHVGRAVMSDQVVGVSSGEIWVNLEAGADHDAALATIEDVVDGYPGLATDLLTYPEERILDVLSGEEDDLVVRLYGEDAGVLEGMARDVRERVSTIAGVARAETEAGVDEPTVEIEVDLARAQRFGVKPGDVRRAAATLLSGIAVGNLFEEQKVFDVVVWGAPHIRQSVDDVRELLIDTPDGRRIPLHRVADVRVAPNPSVIRHESVSRYLDVTADVEGRDVRAVAGDVAAILRGMDFPLEHHAEILGGFAEGQAGRTRVLAVALAAAIGIVLVLQAAFGSWRLAFLVAASLPAALAGGVVAAAIAGGTLTLGSVGGLVAVLSVAVRNGIGLVRHYQRLQRDDRVRFGEALIARGARERVAPVLISAVATAAVMAPVALAGGRAGLELLGPMAVVVLGGLVTATVASLVLLPAAVLRFGGSSLRTAPPEDLLTGLSDLHAVPALGPRGAGG